MLAAIAATWASVWVRAFFAYGISRSIDHRSTLSREAERGLERVGRRELLWPDEYKAGEAFLPYSEVKH